MVEQASCKNSISTSSLIVPFPKEPCKILLSREYSNILDESVWNMASLFKFLSPSFHLFRCIRDGIAWLG